ncbi:MAG: hypothetical protein IKL10_03900 [Clostridia bacterium]|nr:hypothetical protein [Clostridia bacterium]
MSDCEQIQNRKKVVKMAALATPKKNSYILKKDEAQKIVKSKMSKTKKDSIEENAALFARNNIANK